MKAVAATLAALLALAACASQGDPDGLGGGSRSPQPETRTGEPAPTATEDSSQEATGPARPRMVETVASDLAAPWGLTFLPDGSALVTERDHAEVLVVPADGGKPRVVGRVEQAAPQGEGGLLGIAVSPTYEEDQLVYVYVTTASDNRVVRMGYDGEQLGRPQVVLSGIPNGFVHDGGRLEFGPDGYLYVSTGETGTGDLAQDRRSLAGKILRITPDGDPAPGNPVKGSPVWTMGHRNVEGLAFDDDERLWASEFGSETWDELNLVEKARNYGWPLVEGRGDRDEYRNPFAQWRPAEASPAGLAYAEGALWMAALRGARLWRIPVAQDGSIGKPRDFFVGEYGRLRTVVVAPDGSLWLTTSNRDGRGTPGPRDDRILRVELG